MDLLKVFKRQKSRNKKGRSLSQQHSEEVCDLSYNTVPNPDCTPKVEKTSRKSLRNSFHKRVQSGSTSCNEINIQDSNRTARGLNSDQDQATGLALQSNRWSYTPDDDRPVFQSNHPMLHRRHTQGDIAMRRDMLPSHLPALSNPSHELEKPCAGNCFQSTVSECDYGSVLDQLPSPSPAKTSSNDAKGGESDMLETNEYENADDNSSWGSNEFDLDSIEDSPPYDNAILEEGKDSGMTGKRVSSRSNRELSKEISDGVRRLKFLQRKTAIGKKMFKSDNEDDVSTFIDVKFCPDRHPGPHLKEAPANLLPYQCQRRNIIETIILSESSYIDSLERLEINYKKSLLEIRPAIISSDIVEKIFYKVADVLQCHQLFQIALAAAVNDWDKHEKIGDTFVASFSKSMVLECYSNYINNFTLAMELVRKTCKQKPQFVNFLREKQIEGSNHLNLYGLMLKPVQRFPQFILLVQDLLKYTPADHEDSLPLQLALTELEILAENLNRRRADDQERLEMIHLVESSNIKLSSLTKDGRARRLLKQGFVHEITCNDDGSIEKERECLLVLTNDMLLSCSTSSRRPQPRSGFSTLRDIYKLRWCNSLDTLTIVDGSMLGVEELAKNNSDIATLQSISQLAEGLHFSYTGLSTNEIDKHISTLKEKMNQPTPNCQNDSITVQFAQKSGDFTRALKMPDSMSYNDWLESITNAKLACEQKNLHCWFSADGSDPDYLWRPPLFLSCLYCHDSHRTLQVQCAHAFMISADTALLWLACYASTVVATVNIYRFKQEKSEKVHTMQVDSSVQCMEHWNPYHQSTSVWLGMECGSLIEFSTDSEYIKLCEVPMPTMSTVMIMKAYKKELYVGLLDGSLVMYTRPDGFQGLIHKRCITVGSGPLKCLSPLGGKLWGVSGNDVVTIDLATFNTLSTRTIKTGESMTVSHIAQVGSGFWVSFNSTCSIHLYHLDSLELLQDINLSRAIRDFFSGASLRSRRNDSCSITCLSSSYSQLLVGTSNGLVLTMPLPKLPGSVPKITGPCRICYHMFSGSVIFLCAPSFPLKELHVSGTDLNDGFADVPPLVPKRSPIKSHASKTLHKRTSSEGFIKASDTASDSVLSPLKNKRLSSIEPINQVSLDVQRSLNPPALPPKPTSFTEKDDAQTEMRLGDAAECSSKVQEPTVPSSDHKQTRNFPVLLACGDDYTCMEKSDVDPTSETSKTSTAILSWKIV